MNAEPKRQTTVQGRDEEGRWQVHSVTHDVFVTQEKYERDERIRREQRAREQRAEDARRDTRDDS